jgi:hypothetical protein
MVFKEGDDAATRRMGHFNVKRMSTVERKQTL